MFDESRRYGAGDSLEDTCRVCKSLRAHTVIVADPGGRVLRVICDTCGSQHNFRGGEEKMAHRHEPVVRQDSVPAEASGASESRGRFEMSPMGKPNSETSDLESLLRKVIREETGLTPVTIADKWRNGTLVLKPGRESLQESSWPIETFFHKVVMIRNRLRVLEQQVNGADLPEDLKIKLQGYVTACYGSLTSFNVLFAEEDDRFRGAGG